MTYESEEGKYIYLGDVFIPSGDSELLNDMRITHIKYNGEEIND
jgi:hypothetical protein